MRISRSFFIALGLAATAATALAFVLTGYRWANNTAVTFSLRFGTNGVATPFQDGTTTFDQVAEQAASLWNNYLGSGVRIVTVRDGALGNVSPNNGVNEAAFRTNPIGTQSWGNAIAYTAGWFEADGTTFRETDITFRQDYQWNSYRGPLQRGATAASTVFEFRRVMIHELGHALGLDHPDTNGQSVTAVMNSAISDVDVMQLDDINGIQAIYGQPTPTLTPVPTPTPTPTRTPTPTPFPQATSRPRRPPRQPPRPRRRS